MEISIDAEGQRLSTYGGEQWLTEDYYSDDYGISIGDVSIHSIKSDQLKEFAVEAINHLIINGHGFELKEGNSFEHAKLIPKIK